MTVRVTDHALITFMERAGGLDVDALRRSLTRSLVRACAMAEQVGERDFVMKADGLEYIVKSGALITVVAKRRRRMRRRG